jgi:hypothetical protein
VVYRKVDSGSVGYSLRQSISFLGMRNAVDVIKGVIDQGKIPVGKGRGVETSSRLSSVFGKMFQLYML